jgi:hypothetical protein
MTGIGTAIVSAPMPTDDDAADRLDAAVAHLHRSLPQAGQLRITRAWSIPRRPAAP